MSKFYETPEFLALNRLWREKVATGGGDFIDIEDEQGNLKQHDRRTLAFENRQRIQTFFSELASYLLKKNAKIPPKHRHVLDLYCQGVHIDGPGGISEQTDLCVRQCTRVIRKYRDLVIKQ